MIRTKPKRTSLLSSNNNNIIVCVCKGDLNGDKTTVEIAVGAPGDDTVYPDAGAVYIISLNSCK